MTLTLHILAGILVLACGFGALFSTKGGPLHRNLGRIFTLAMLLTASSAIIMDINQGNWPVMGVFSGYLAISGWQTVRKPLGHTGWSDVVILVIGATLALGLITLGLEGVKPGKDIPSEMFLIFGTVASLAAMGDLRRLLRGGGHHAMRITRHLWRMCTALILSLMAFLAQPVFPEILRGGWLWLPVFALVLTTLYWMVRTLRGKPVS